MLAEDGQIVALLLCADFSGTPFTCLPTNILCRQIKVSIFSNIRDSHVYSLYTGTSPRKSAFLLLCQ